MLIRLDDYDAYQDDAPQEHEIENAIYSDDGFDLDNHVSYVRHEGYVIRIQERFTSQSCRAYRGEVTSAGRKVATFSMQEVC